MTKKQPREQRMDAIVSAAVAEFLDRGYENSSMEAIATRAELTKGGLYHHFQSKQEILGYANLRLTEPIEEFVARAAQSASALNGLRGYVKNTLRFWAAHPRELSFFFLTMTKAFEMPEMKRLYAAYYQQTQARFAALFARAAQQGELRPHDSAARALALLAALDGALGFLVFDDGASVDQVVRQLQDVFLNSLSVDSTPKARIRR
jgi:AcrR family transcriptional regulator